MDSIGTPWMWAAFGAFVTLALFVDLRVLRHAGPHRVTMREALAWSAAWVALALVFNAALWWYVEARHGAALATEVALQFFTGYLVEKTLAVDNIFVFLLLFNYFAVPAEQQQRVLVYGVLGAIVLRAIMILLGAALIARFDWILYLFGGFLLLTGIKMLWTAGEQPDLEANPILRWIRSHLRVTPGYHDGRFVVGAGADRRYTPLFVVMVMIGVTDLVFAVDSIPAIFAITTDPFIVLTSNVFAVLGLRALFFMLAGVAERFHLLGHGLALVLVLIGAKMLVADVWHVPTFVSLGIVATIIAGSMLLSVVLPPRPPTQRRRDRVGELVLGALSREIHAPATDPGSGNTLAVLEREFPDLRHRVAGRTVLDFGCGDGHQAAALAALGARVTGLDTSTKALEAARAAHPGLRFVESTDETFDVVVSQNAMEHFPQPEETLQRMLDRVGPGGSLLLTFGPPWFAPYGAHMRFFCRVPWIQLLFSERAIMAVRARYRRDGATRFEDVEQGLNRMSVARFERMIDGMRVTQRHYRCVRGLQFLARIPLLRELFVNQVTVVVAPEASAREGAQAQHAPGFERRAGRTTSIAPR
jgi:tellurite resistance protein TerC